MLTVEGAAVERGGRLVMAAPDFAVEAGEAAILSGPNGAGKSTLLRALAGLLPLKRGDVRLGALDLVADVEAFAASVAYAGHLDAVKPALSVRANLEIWAAIFESEEDAVVDRALERFALSHMAEAPAAYCSAGQKRRLGLGRLLVSKRPLWLLDEPTVSLDAANAAVFAELVAEHCATGGYAVAATHIDIGLPAGPRIALAPPPAEDEAGADPFLSGEWA